MIQPALRRAKPRFIHVPAHNERGNKSRVGEVQFYFQPIGSWDKGALDRGGRLDRGETPNPGGVH